MTLHYADDSVTLHHGDCLDVLLDLPDCSVDSVVTDPPYGLEFMGKEWDRFSGAVTDRDFKGFVLSQQRTRNVKCPECGKWAYDHPGRLCECGGIRRAQGNAFQQWCDQWATECLRVLKPGGHLLAFGGSRTWHRLAVAVEDAGFEIRDSIAWLSGSGFPKSLNVNKDPRFCQCPVGESHCADDQMCGVRDDVSRPAAHSEAGGLSDLFTAVQRQGARPGVGDTWAQGPRCPDPAELHRGGSQDEWTGESSLEGRGDAQAAEGQLQGREIRSVPSGITEHGPGGRLHHGAPAGDGSMDRQAAGTVGSGEPQGPRPVEQRPREPRAVPVERGSQAGRGWPVCGGCSKPRVTAGLGTALKPAFEPVVVARKPLAGTVAANVLQHGTGALNIDGCRVVPSDRAAYEAKCASVVGLGSNRNGSAYGEWTGERQDSASPGGRWPTNVVLDETQAAELDRQTGVLTSGGGDRRSNSRHVLETRLDANNPRPRVHEADSGGASRFFPTFRYEAKAATSERPTGEDGTAHPTVKPLDLMRWLVRLVTPPGGTVLEPFAGSGTTIEACIHEGFRCIAVEREAAYLPLILQRITKPMQTGFDFGEVSA